MARTASTSKSKHAAQESNSFLLSGPRHIAIPRMVLLLAVFILTMLGIVMVFSASTIEAINEGVSATSYVTRQVLVAGVSLLVTVGIVVLMPYYRWLDMKFLGPAYGVVIVLLLLTAGIGTAELGAQRWLSLGPISFQPSELAKPAFVLMMAYILYRSRIEEEYDFWTMTKMTVLLVALPLFFLLVAQSDLGTTAICFVGILAVLWLSDVPLPVFFAVLGGAVVFAFFAVIAKGYRLDRLSFLNPQDDYYGSGYQLVRSFYAFAQGGIFGVGLGNSTEKYLYLPEAETDFIFAIIGEELGLVGALLVVILFLAVLWAGLQIARNAPDIFGTMIAGSCTAMLVFQAFLNMGCVVGLLPTTGKPLPFISAGGSSLLGSFILVGLILSVSFASSDTSGVYEQRRNDLVVVRNTSRSSRSSSTRSAQRSSNSSRSSNQSDRNRTRAQSARGAARNRRRRS